MSRRFTSHEPLKQCNPARRALASDHCAFVFHVVKAVKVYEQGVEVSGVPLMLSVLRCGSNFKFIGRDQEACWTHSGYCYDYEASKKHAPHDINVFREEGESWYYVVSGMVSSAEQQQVVVVLTRVLALVNVRRHILV